MAQLIVEFRVSDYQKYRTNFDKGARYREEAGITNCRIFRDVDDQNSIVVVSDATDEAKALAIFNNPETRKLSQEVMTASPRLHFVK